MTGNFVRRTSPSAENIYFKAWCALSFLGKSNDYCQTIYSQKLTDLISCHHVASRVLASSSFINLIFEDIRLVDKSLDNQLASSFFTTSNKSAYTCCNLPVFGCTKACGESLRSHHSSLIILHTSYFTHHSC